MNLLILMKDMLLPPEQSVLAQMLIQMCSHANWVVSGSTGTVYYASRVVSARTTDGIR